jgi:hypothetical protein
MKELSERLFNEASRALANEPLLLTDFLSFLSNEKNSNYIITLESVLVNNPRIFDYLCMKMAEDCKLAQNHKEFEKVKGDCTLSKASLLIGHYTLAKTIAQPVMS